MNEKLLTELSSHYVNYLEQKKLCEKTNQCSFFITGKSEILQEQFICSDCFPSEKFGICRICIKQCHSDHNVKFFRRSRFYCQCAILGHQCLQKGKQISTLHKCIIYNIDSILQQKLTRCPRCNIYLCYFCMTDGYHKAHFDQLEQNEINKFLEIEENIDQDNLITEKKMQRKQNRKASMNVIVCQCDDQKHHKINKMRSFTLNYKEYILQQTQNPFYMYTLFNMLFEQEQIYEKLLKDFCKNMELMTNHYLQTGDAKLCHQNQFLDYVQIYEHLKLVDILYQTKHRFLFISTKFTNIMNIEYIYQLLVNYPKIQHQIDELSINYADQIYQYLLDCFYICMKKDIGFLWKIETKTIENHSPLRRIAIGEFSNHYCETKDVKLDYDLIFNMLQNFLQTIYTYDRQQMQQRLLRFCLKSIKVVLKSRLLRIGQEYTYLQQLLKILKNELQKPSFLQNIYMVDEKTLALLSDILIQSYFYLKDLKFIETLQFHNIKIENSKYMQIPNIAKQKGYFDKYFFQSKLNESDQYSFIYDTKDSVYVDMYSILFSVILNYKQNIQMVNYKQTIYRYKLDNNIQKLLQEQCYNNTLYNKSVLLSDQTEFYQINDLVKMISNEENIFEKCRRDLNTKFVQRFLLGQRFINVNEQSDVMELHTYIDQIIKTSNFEQFLLYISNEDRNQFIDSQQKDLLKQQLLAFQIRMFRGRIEGVIIRLLSFYPLIFKSNNKILHSQIIAKCLDILRVYAYDNQTNSSFLFKQNNLEIFKKIIKKTDTFYEFSSFYYQLIIKESFYLNNYYYLLDHLYFLIEFVDQKYYDISEISNFQYSNLLSFRININECLYQIIHKPFIMKVDFTDKNTMINDCFMAMAKRLLKILKEMFNNRKTQQSQPIKFIKIPIINCLETVNHKITSYLKSQDILILISNPYGFQTLSRYFKTQLELSSLKSVQLLLITIKLLNILMENNENIFPHQNFEVLQEIFTDVGNSQLTVETFDVLYKLYRSSNLFMEIQTELFRFFNIHFLKAKNILTGFEKRHFEQSLIVSDYLKVEMLSKKIIALKQNISFLQRIIVENMSTYLDKVKIVRLMMKKSINFLLDYSLFAVYYPFEMIISFTKLVGESGLLSGKELQTIKDLIQHFLQIKDLFIKILIKQQLPNICDIDQIKVKSKISHSDSYQSELNSTICIDEKYIIKFSEIISLYQEKILNNDYIQVYDLYVSRKSMILRQNRTIRIIREAYPKFHEFYEKIHDVLINLDISEKIQKTALYSILSQTLKAKNSCQMNNVYLTHLLTQINDPYIFYPVAKRPDNNFVVFDTIVNQINQFNRLIQFNIKLMQNHLKQFIEVPANRILFEQVLDKVFTIMPKLFSLIKNYENHFQDKRIYELGEKIIQFLQFYRYICEEQNKEVQLIMSESGMLRKLIGLLEILLKSWQTELLISKQPISLKKEENKSSPISKTFIQLFSYCMITISEIALGPCLENQKIISELYSQQKIWPIILRILTNDTIQNNEIFTIRYFVMYNLVSIIEGQNLEQLETIMQIINYKILEETLINTFKSIVYKHLGIHLDENDSHSKISMMKICKNLVILYKKNLGQDIHETYSPSVLIKTLSQVYQIFQAYKMQSREVRNYLKSYKLKIQENIKVTYTGIISGAFLFLKEIMLQIEYIDADGKFKTYLFMKPDICFFLSNETIIQFYEEVDRSNWSSKITQLIENFPYFQIEMMGNRQKFQKYPNLVELNVNKKYNFHSLKWLNILNLMTILINVLMNFSYIYSNNKIVRKNLIFIQILTYINLILTLTFLFFVLFMRLKIYYQIEYQKRIKIKKKQKQQMNNIVNLLALANIILMKKDITPFLFHAVLSLLGIFYSEYFFTIQCFSIAFYSATMKSVLEALKIRYKKFIGIMFLIIIILNNYSYIGFLFFSKRFTLMAKDSQGEEHKKYLCNTPFNCLISLIYYGLRENGMTTYAEPVSQDDDTYVFFQNFVFDLVFFLTISLVMLNIINGIIIDAFADLRDKQHMVEYDKENVCFICNIEKWEIEKQGQIFKNHVEGKHNLWNYAFFLVYLNVLGGENANGTESYLMERIRNRNLNWLPQHNREQQ